MDVSRGAVLALGFMIGRILYRENNRMTSSSSAATAADENARVEKMDVDSGSACSDSALNSVVSSAVSQLGEYFTRSISTYISTCTHTRSFQVRLI